MPPERVKPSARYQPVLNPAANMSAKAISLNSADITLNAVNDVISIYNAATITGGTINMQSVGNTYLEGAALNATKPGLLNSTAATTLTSTAGNIYAPASMTTVSGGVSINAAGFVEMDAASNGAIINSAGDVGIAAGSSISAFGASPSAAWMQVTGSKVTLNAGTALYAANLAHSIADGIRRAQEVIANGAAREKLDTFVRFTRQFS